MLVYMHTTNPPLVASREVCERLGIDRSTLTRWVQAGRIEPAMKLDGLRGGYLFAPETVESLAQKQSRRAS